MRSIFEIIFSPDHVLFYTPPILEIYIMLEKFGNIYLVISKIWKIYLEFSIIWKKNLVIFSSVGSKI